MPLHPVHILDHVMPKTPDRRSVRSKKAMRDALVSLLAKQPFAGIKAEDLVAASQLGRSTFYAHCSGKEDLLRRSLQALREELVAEHAARVRARSVSAPRVLLAADLVFEHVARHRHVYPSVARGRPAEIWQREMSLIVAELIERDLAAFSWRCPIAPDVAVKMLGGALLELLTWWLKTNQSHSIETLSDSYQRLARGVLE